MKECVLELGDSVMTALGKVSNLVANAISKRKFLPNRELNNSPSAMREARIKKLKKLRSQISKELYDKLTTRRSGGSLMEKPTSEAFAAIKKLQERNERIDRLLNRLEGIKPVIIKNKDGSEMQIPKKRWNTDEFNLEKFRNFTSTARREYEESIIQDVLSKGVKSDKPLVVMMMGGPASGKSTLLESKFNGKPKGFVVIDPDDIKSRLPEFQFGLGTGIKEIAGIVHTNSSRIAKEITTRARRMGLNVIVDGTGSDYSIYSDLANKFNARGYNIQLLAQHVPEEVGVKRAVLRAEMPVSMGGGRFVPLKFIEEAYQNVPRNFLPMSKLVDSASLNDNVNGKMIMEFEKGKQTFKDPEADSQYRRDYAPNR